VNVGEVYRAESRAVLATLIRLLGDFDLAEEALQDAFTAAVERWDDDPPAHPRAWLVSTGRFKAIDRLRRRARFDRALGDLALLLEASEPPPETDLPDDRLRLIFTCCHPALPADAQVAMTLREVCGLTTEEIARAFLTRPPTVAQRIVRAKARIRTEGIPYEVPARDALHDRLATVLHVVYLVFTEGYAPAAGGTVVRADLADEAIRLGRLLAELLPLDGEVHGLLALMLLQDSRRAARTTADGSSSCSPTRTVRGGTGTGSPRGPRHSNAPAVARTPSRPRSPPPTPRRPPPRPPTGTGSSRCTTPWPAPTRHRWSR
jgi:RNA polymerase sigma-70 factor, ECF subfamily